MHLLVAVASKHGSTGEIAAQIGAVLREAGHEVTVRRIQDVESVTPYDAVVVGSAVYMGKWMDEAHQFVDRCNPGLRQKPVWLFSCGSLPSDKQREWVARSEQEGLIAATGALDYHLFAGKIDPASLRLAEKLVIKAVHAPPGDYRDWEEIGAWASGIAATLPAPLLSQLA